MNNEDEEYVELESSVRMSKGLMFSYLLICLLLIGYFVFLGVLVWQIDSNTHEIAETAIELRDGNG